MEFENRDFKGVWIPKTIYLCEELTPLDKIIFAEIDSLDVNHAGCFASNEYLAKFSHCSESAITKSISKLTRLGFIETASFNGRQRVLRSRVVDFTRQSSKIYEAESENLRGYIDSNNNIYNNTMSNIDDKHSLYIKGKEITEKKSGSGVKKKADHSDEVKDVVAYLNKVCGTRYSCETEETKKHIIARLNDGFSVDDMKKVIDKKYRDWGNDARMKNYLRPITLFAPSKFESYLNIALMGGGENYGNRPVRSAADITDKITLNGHEDEELPFG